MQLKGKWNDIPRDENGNPQFHSLKELANVFREDEIVALVNRALYHANMQRDSHKKNYRSKATGKPIGRPKNALNLATTKGETRELAKLAQDEANEALEREDEAMRKWVEEQKGEERKTAEDGLC
jgi:hypothetical protein